MKTKMQKIDPDPDAPRNWPDDNDRYLNLCGECGEYFFGNKYRQTCRMCQTQTK